MNQTWLRFFKSNLNRKALYLPNIASLTSNGWLRKYLHFIIIDDKSSLFDYFFSDTISGITVSLTLIPRKIFYSSIKIFLNYNTFFHF